MTSPDHLVEIRLAAARIDGRVRRTPLLECDLAPGVMVKPESLQVTGSFKARGAFNAVLALLERQPGVPGVVTHSSGNHAQALAYASRSAGLPSAIVIPESVTPYKIEATRKLGAEVISEGVTFDNREEIAEQLSRERGWHLLHPFDDWDVIHGAGTTALEILEDGPAPAAIIVPIGGGGHIAGIALAVAAMSPQTEVIGVEPVVAADAAASLRSGAHEALAEDPATIAEGVKVKSIGARNFDVIVRRHLVSRIITVSEDQIRNALAVAWRSLRLVIEPTAALAVAAHLSGEVSSRPGAPVVLVLTGGNVDPAQLAGLVNSA
jgi:threonine dehydratase